MGGRLDHTLGNLNVLHMFEGLHLVLCGEGNLTRLIPAGDSVILPVSDFPNAFSDPNTLYHSSTPSPIHTRARVRTAQRFSHT
jgi:thiamine pyrophosphokinase